MNLDGEVITDIERDGAHRMIARTQAALVSQFQYDPVGRLLSQTAGPLGAGFGASPVIARRYEYDEVGNLATIDDARNGVTRYGYDPIGRILSAVQPDLSERFAFDPAHNLIDTTVAAAAGRVEGNRVRVYEDKRYDYDAHGNVVEKRIGKHTRMRFEWNVLHQLVRSVVARSSSDTEQTVSYTYDPFGRRIAKRDAFGVTRFVWDGNRLLCEQRGSVSRTYVYGEEAFVPLARVDAVADANGGGAARAEVRHLHTDHLGTPRELTDADGRVVWTARYRAWGNVLQVVYDEASSVPAIEGLSDGLASAQPVRFQGQYFDDETGLHYNRFRYYDPDVGRFISVDPIGLSGGANTYNYTPNPIYWVDPLGLAPCDSTGKGGANTTGTAPMAADRVIQGIDPRQLNRSHSIEGKRSTARVEDIANSMREKGFNGPSIDVVEANGKYYIVDGHHRAAAALQTGTKVDIRIIDDIKSQPSSWGTVAEVVRDAEMIGPHRLIPKGKYKK